LHLLLVAVSILKERLNIPVRLRITGAGDASAFQSLAKNMRLNDCVEFLGSLKNAAVRQQMQNADLFCFPSLLSPNWTEQFGFALVEAMAHGLPVVAFDSGAIREICGQDGVYASAGNAFSLAEGLATLIRNESDALSRGQRLQRRALTEFDAEEQGRKMLEAIL